MMTTLKRPRGRPVGTGKDDSATLRAVADLLLSQPALRPTTAFKRIVRGAGLAHIRRFQVKWREHGQTLLANAKRRADQQRGGWTPARRGGQAATDLGAYEQFRLLSEQMSNHPHIKALQKMADHPHLKALQDLANHPHVKAIRDMDSRLQRTMEAAAGGAAMKAIRDMESRLQATMEAAAGGPTMKAIQDMDSRLQKAVQAAADSPTMRAIRDMENSPAMKAIRDIENSPTMKALRRPKGSPNATPSGVTGSPPGRPQVFLEIPALKGWFFSPTLPSVRRPDAPAESEGT